MSYVLHYAPDNASMVVRMALDHLGLPYTTKLVDRAARQQETEAYRALNPNGLIPVLETPQGPLFETGAILLWLADNHGGLGPAPDEAQRGGFLKWLFFVANTLHPSLRMLFHPERYIAPDHTEALRTGMQVHLHRSFSTLDTIAASQPGWLAGTEPTVLDFYTAAMLRWSALYPTGADRSWFALSNYPALRQLCAHLETLSCTHGLQKAEGLGITPFTDPHPPTPPEGSAT